MKKYFCLYLVSIIVELTALVACIYVSRKHVIENTFISIVVNIWIISVALMIVSDVWKAVLIFKDGKNEDKND